MNSPTSRYGGQFGPTERRRSEYKMPRFFKRLFKFPQMDFENAVWEMKGLIFAPQGVFKSIFYQKQMRNSWHRPDPAFTYLLSFFLLLTSLAWSLAYTPRPLAILKLAFMFVFIHFLLGSLLVSTFFYFVIGRFLGPGIAGLPGRRRQQGLFPSQPTSSSSTSSTSLGGSNTTAESLEFGYCFDVATRAFFPPYVFLYILQYILMPAIDHQNKASTFVANTLYLVAAVYWSLITFLGFNGLTFLHHTRLLLAPVGMWALGWLICTGAGVNLERWGVGWLFWGVEIRGKA